MESESSFRRADLNKLMDRYYYLFEGVRNILTAVRDGTLDCIGVVGPVVDLLEVPHHLILAVETVLGGSLQSIVTETSRDAQICIEYLKQNKLGRASFIPLDQVRPRPRLVRDFRHQVGVFGEMVDLVGYDEKYDAAMTMLLAGTLVVDSLSLARELADTGVRGIRIVTLDGDVVSPKGIMTGGRGKYMRIGLLQRKDSSWKAKT